MHTDNILGNVAHVADEFICSMKAGIESHTVFHLNVLTGNE